MPQLFRQSFCPHCKKAPPSKPCSLCGVQVCDECARTLAHCGRERVVEIRAGRRRRLTFVDPSGKIAVVSRRRDHLLSLERAAFVDSPVDVREAVPGLGWRRKLAAPRIVCDFRLLYEHRFGSLTAGWEAREFALFDRRGRLLDTIARGANKQTLYPVLPITRQLGQQVSVSQCGTALLIIHSDYRIELWPLTPPYDHLDLHPPLGDAVQSVAFDADLRLLAIGTWGHVQTYELEGGLFEPRRRRKISDQDVPWLGIARGRLVALSSSSWGIGSIPGRRSHLHCLALDAEGRVDDDPTTLTVKGEPGRRAISSDGRLFAVARSDGVVLLLDLATGGKRELRGTRRRICYLRFVDNDNRLVVGDHSGRILVWPRAIYSGKQSPGPSTLVSPTKPDPNKPLVVKADPFRLALAKKRITYLDAIA